jgi:hypothetical protein
VQIYLEILKNTNESPTATDEESKELKFIAAKQLKEK